MKKIFLILAALLIVGCSAKPAEEAEEKTSRSPLGVESASTPNETAPTPKASPEAAQVIVAEPKTVNLEEVPAASAAQSENLPAPVEMPAPGSRFSETQLRHDTSLDLSKQLGVDPSEVSFIEIIPTTWSDGSLGCPAEGVAYIEAEVEGFKLIFAVQGKKYDYHTAGLTSFLWCKDGEPISPLD